MTTNRQWLINGQPRGRAVTVEDFALNEAQLEPLADGEVRIKVQTLSFDPSQKGQMENVGYAAATGLGQVMTARGIGEVIESRSADYGVGDTVLGPMGWQEIATVQGSLLTAIDEPDLATAYLGPLGGNGLTAYFGFFRKGMPEAGDVLVVSGAAGATGSIVGQLGVISGCTVIGIAGGPDKCRSLTDELGFHHAIDYKNDSVKGRLKELAPGGMNIFFDNVGGDILDAALARISLGARIVICGGISRYQAEGLPPGPGNYMNLVFMRSTMAGFLLTDYTAEFPMATARLKQWIQEGRLKYAEDMQHGFDNIPSTLLRLFAGQNTGKQLLSL